MMSSDNDKVFSEAMADVVPLKREPRIDLARMALGEQMEALARGRTLSLHDLDATAAAGAGAGMGTGVTSGIGAGAGAGLPRAVGA